MSIATRPAFIEGYLEGDRLFYRPVGEEKHEGVLLYTPEEKTVVAQSHYRKNSPHSAFSGEIWRLLFCVSSTKT